MQEGQPVDPDMRKAWMWWKLKKWVLHVTNRIFGRFGNSKQVKGDHQKAFAVMFSKQWAGRFLNSYLQVRQPVREGESGSTPSVQFLLMAACSRSVLKEESHTTKC